MIGLKGDPRCTFVLLTSHGCSATPFNQFHYNAENADMSEIPSTRNLDVAIKLTTGSYKSETFMYDTCEIAKSADISPGQM